MKKSGFTLVEIMIVVAIVAILVALALPNYNESVRKARRSDAQEDLLKIAGEAERVFTQTNSYRSLDADLNGRPDGYTSSYYVYSFTSLTDTSYIVRAGPTGTQAGDKCGAMNLSNTGVREHTGTLAGCW